MSIFRVFSVGEKRRVQRNIPLTQTLGCRRARGTGTLGLATIVRIMLMYYIDVQGFLEHPEKDWEESLSAMMESPPEPVETEK